MVDNKTVPIQAQKPFEMVYELKNEVPSFEEFIKSYEYDANLNYDDLNNNDISEAKGYGPCSSHNCSYSSSFYIKIKLRVSKRITQTYFRAGNSCYAVYYGNSQWTRRETGFMWHKSNWEAEWIEAYSIDAAEKFLEGLRKGYDTGMWISCESDTGSAVNAETKSRVISILEENIEKHRGGENVLVDTTVFKGCSGTDDSVVFGFGTPFDPLDWTDSSINSSVGERHGRSSFLD